MKKRIALLLSLIAILASPLAQAQNWGLFRPEPGGLHSAPIIDMENSGTSWLTYVLHPSSISRFNGLWDHSPDTFGAGKDGGSNNSLYYDRNGSGLWIGRTTGLYFVAAAALDTTNPKAENLTKLCFPDSTADPPSVTAIYRDSEQNLWIGTSDLGAVRCSGNGNNLVIPRPNRRFVITDITESFYSDSMAIWMGTLSGIYVFSVNGNLLNTLLVGTEIYNLLTDREGRVWAATNAGLRVATDPNRADFATLSTPRNCEKLPPVDLNIRDVKQDDYGSVWTAASDKVYRYWPKEDQQPEEWEYEVICSNQWPSALSEIIRLAVDRAGFVWVASRLEGQGILCYNMIWENIRPTQLANVNVRSDTVNTLYLSPVDGSLYVGTIDGAAYRDSVGNWQPIDLEKICFKRSTIHSFYHDATTTFVLVGTSCLDLDCKLAVLDATGTFPLRCNYPEGCIRDNVFKSIVKLPDGIFWLAGNYNLVSTRVDSVNGRKEFICIRDSLILGPQQFHTILLEKNSYVWIGTNDSGLLRYDIANRTFSRVAVVGHFESKRVLSLHLDDMDTLWIGTERGLTRTNSNLVFEFPIWHDLTDTGAVNFVFSGRKNDIWFDAPDGVAHYSREAGVTYFPSPQSNTVGGPPSQNVHMGLSLSEKGREAIWFGTDAGISIFHGDSIPPETRIIPPSSPDPHFVFIPPNKIRLSSSTLLVEYTGGDKLTAGQNLSFRTRLERASDGTVIQRKVFSQNRAEQLFFPETGLYHYYVEARDQSGNIDRTPAVLVLDVDLDAPSVVITEPSKSDLATWVRDTLFVRGSIIDKDLKSYTVGVIDFASDSVFYAKTITGDSGNPLGILPEIRAGVLDTVLLGKYKKEFLSLVIKAVDILGHNRSDTVKIRVDAEPPKLNILQPDSRQKQVLSTLEVVLEIEEKHLVNRLEYFEGENFSGFSEVDLTPVESQGALRDTVQIPIREALGERKLTLIINDLTGNQAKQTIQIFRVHQAPGNRSEVYISQDSLVYIYLPPGEDAITILISPLARIFTDSISQFGLEPVSLAYLIEAKQDNTAIGAFGREAPLTFKIDTTVSESSRLRIFRQGINSWQPIGGRFTKGESLLRAVINQGGVYLAALGETGNFNAGNVTCLPRMFSPGRNSPSPFTEVTFTLDRESPVSIHIFNTAGRRVKTLIRDGEIMPPGRHPVQWDGRDESGDRLRNGIYIVVVKTNSFAETKTVVIQN